MHEFSLADELIRSVTRLTADHAGTIVEVELVIGELTAVHCEALTTAFEALRPDTRLAGAVLCCRIEPVRVACSACGAEGQPPDPLLLLCPACESPQVRITSGRQIDIVRIRVDEPESAADPPRSSDPGGESSSA